MIVKLFVCELRICCFREILRWLKLRMVLKVLIWFRVSGLIWLCWIFFCLKWVVGKCFNWCRNVLNLRLFFWCWCLVGRKKCLKKFLNFLSILFLWKNYLSNGNWWLLLKRLWLKLKNMFLWLLLLVVLF